LNATEISTIYTEGVAGRTVNNTLVDNRNIPADSRVAYWSFNTNQSGNATDSWGINNGTCSGTTCPVWNSSGATQFNGVNNYGGSYNFDGSKYLDYSSQVIPIGAKSISFWIKTSSTTDGMLLDNCLRTSYNHGTTIDVNLLHSGKIIFWSLKGTVGVYRFNLESNTAINNNIWHYVTFAWDGTTNANAVKIYIDGSLDNTMTATATETTTATASLAVGSGADHSSKFNGSIDDIMIFNRSLSATEVSDLYNTQKLHINLDELNGTKATDTSGLGNNGTLTNYPTTATTAPIWNATGGRNGTGAYVFDGVDDYISISQTMFQPTTPLTYSAWVNRYSAPSANFAGVVTGPGSFGANAASYIMIADTSNYMYCYFFTTGNSWVYAKSNSIIPLNTWAHYTCQWNGTTALMYVNGIQQTTTASLSAIIYGPGTGQQFFAIGKYLGAPSVYWNGSIDNVLFFNRVLNSSEVLALYNSP
jgi:hypothetical protein